MASDGLLLLVLGAFGALLVFLILREFWTWYWKQSEQVRLLKRIAESLERLEARPDARPEWRSPSGWAPAPSIPEPMPKSLLDRLADRVG